MDQNLLSNEAPLYAGIPDFGVVTLQRNPRTSKRALRRPKEEKRPQYSVASASIHSWYPYIEVVFLPDAHSVALVCGREARGGRGVVEV